MRKTIWTITAAVCLGHMLFAVANVSQGVLLTSFIDAFRLESGMQGFPNAAANIGVLAAMLLAVPLASQMGKPRLFLCGLGLMALMLALAGASQGAWWLILAYLVMGLGFGFIDTTASSIVADLHTGKRAYVLMGVLHAVYGTGGVLAPIAMTASLSAGVSWRTILWVLSLAVMAACLVSIFIFSRGKAVLRAESSLPEPISITQLSGFVHQRGNLPLVLCSAFYCAHQVSLYLWISRIIEVSYGNVSLGATALALFWVGTVASRLLVPQTSLGTVRYMRYGMLLTAAVLLLGTIIGGAVVLCVTSAIAGLISGASMPMLLTEINRRNKARSMLSITAVLLTTAIAAIICAPLVGFVVGKTTLIAGLVVSAIFCIGAGLTAFFIKEQPIG